MANLTIWYYALFEHDSPDARFQRADDSEHIREGVANIHLPNGDDQSSIIIVRSGWGYEFYPVVGWGDAAGQLVATYLDFMICWGPM